MAAGVETRMTRIGIRFASPECGRGHLAGVHGKMFQYITLLCRRVRLGDVYRTSCARKRVAIFLRTLSV